MAERKNWLKRVFEEQDIRSVSLGRFSPEMVAFILEKKPAFQGRISDKKDILFWRNRIKHTERHQKDFSSVEEFERCMDDIPDIIQNPDYISIHPTDESVSFIRKYSKNVSVAIRISADGKEAYRTMYPLRDSQLQHYIEGGRAWKWEKSGKHN